MHPTLFPFVLGYPGHAEPGLGQGRQRLVVASGLPGARDPPLLESNDGVARICADVAALFLQRALPAQWFCPGSPRV